MPKASSHQRRLEKRERRKEQHETQSYQQYRRRFWRRVVSIVLGSFLVLGILIAWNQGLFGKRSPEYDAFAQCLTDQGMVMYGTDWCPHCQNQKRMFGDAFESIEFVNCDFKSGLCKQKNIEGYPTWYHGDTYFDKGVLTFEELGKEAGCEVPKPI